MHREAEMVRGVVVRFRIGGLFCGLLAANVFGADLATVGTVLGALPARNGDLATLNNTEIGANTVLAKGCVTADDGGGGLFVWSSSNGTDDGGTIIVPDGTVGSVGACWKRVCSGPKNVRWFGAQGVSGNDTIALENAFSALGNNDTLEFAPGSYGTTQTIDLKNRIRVKILGNGAYIFPTATWSGGPVLDMCGTAYGELDSLRICPSGGVTPAAALVLGRTGTSSGGSNVVRNCVFEGSYSVSTVYSCGSECLSFFGGYISGSAQPAYWDTSIDDQNLTGCPGQTQSNTRKYFYATNFKSGWSDGDVIRLRGFCQEIAIYDAYIYLPTGVVISSEGTSKLTAQNCRVEATASSGYADSRFLRGTVCEALIKQLNWTIPSDYIIEVPDDCVLSYSDIAIPRIVSTQTKAILIAGGGLAMHNRLAVPGSGIQVDGGSPYGVAGGNDVITFDGGYPFTGAGQYDGTLWQLNLTRSAMPYDCWVALPSVRRQLKVWANSTAGWSGTRDVWGFSLYTCEDSATTTVTNFTNAQPGQDITIIFTTDQKTTIQNNASIKLKGGVDYTPKIGDTLTLVKDGRWGVWREINRTQNP